MLFIVKYYKELTGAGAVGLLYEYERNYTDAATAYRAACRIGKRISGYHFMTVHQK